MYRDMYEFLGWCTANPGSSASCPGQLYKGSIDLDNGNNSYTFYATWKQLSNLSSFRCSSLQNGQSTTVWCSNCKGAIWFDDYRPGNKTITKRSGVCIMSTAYTSGSNSSEVSSYCSSLGGGMRIATTSECTANIGVRGHVSGNNICKSGGELMHYSDSYGNSGDCVSTN